MCVFGMGCRGKYKAARQLIRQQTVREQQTGFILSVHNIFSLKILPLQPILKHNNIFLYVGTT